jgi:uncharacterized membrane protein
MVDAQAPIEVGGPEWQEGVRAILRLVAAAPNRETYVAELSALVRDVLELEDAPATQGRLFLLLDAARTVASYGVASVLLAAREEARREGEGEDYPLDELDALAVIEEAIENERRRSCEI